MLLLDKLGRRDVTLHGCWLQAVFLFLIGALGSKANPSASDTNGMVASFIIYAGVLHASLGPAAYITAAEIGTSSLREKTMALSVSLLNFPLLVLTDLDQTAVNVVVGFVVVFTTPYLLSAPYAALGPKLGYIWGSFAVIGAVWVLLFMPELKGRTLEEIDQLFAANLKAWQFKRFQTEGMSATVAQYQLGDIDIKQNMIAESEGDAIEEENITPKGNNASVQKSGGMAVAQA